MHKCALCIDIPKYKPSKIRLQIIEISTKAAEQAKGLDVCKNKCATALRGDPKRCCSDCNPSYFSLKELAIISEELDMKPHNKPKNRGFLGPKGCTLPRSYRPNLCLTFTCHSMEKHNPIAHGMLLAAQTLTWDPHEYNSTCKWTTE